MTDLTDGYHYAIVFNKERIIEKKKDFPIPYCEGFCCRNYRYLAPVPSYEEWNKMNEELKDYEYEHKQYAMSYEDTFCKLEAARKENKQLKENIHSMLFTDDVVQERYDKAKKENTELKELLKECRENMPQ